MPEPIAVASLVVDGEPAVPWISHGRVGNLAVWFNRSGKVMPAQLSTACVEGDSHFPG